MRFGAKGAIGLLCALAVLAGAAYRWPMRSARVAAQISETISPRLGLRLIGPENANFALLPWPTLRVVGIELVDAGGRTVLSAPSVKLELSLLGLLRGRVIPLAATLRSPTALIDLDTAALAFANESAGADGRDDPPAVWPHVRLRGGLLHVVSAAQGVDTLIENVEGALDWPSLDRPFALALTGAWRDETVRISGSVDSPMEAIEDRSTGLRLAIESRPLDLTLNGIWNGQPAGYVGDVSARSRSLSALERILGAPATPASAGGSLSLEGKAQTSGAAISLSEAHFAFAGQVFDGDLTYARENGVSALSGTLAADSLNIDALVGPPPKLLAEDGGWSRASIAFAPPRDLDLDLRLSATRPEWGGHHIEDAAGSLMSHGGLFTASLLEASAYQGVMKGQLTLSNGAEGIETQVTGSIADADVGAALADFGWTGYHGRGGIELSLRSTGASPADAVASLAGTATIELQAGVIAGVNIEEAMRRSQRRPVDVARDMATGQTTFTRARAQLAIASGKATIADASVEGPGALLAIEGAIDLPARQLNARLVATQADAQGAPSVDAARLTIVFSGPWSAPAVVTAPGG
jgi:AsmA protein